MAGQSEYQRIVQLGPELRVAIQDHLDGLSVLLLSAGLISDDNAAELTNKAHTSAHRAVKALEFIRNRVKLSSENYYTFVKALKDDKENWSKEILKIREPLDDKSAERLGGLLFQYHL